MLRRRTLYRLRRRFPYAVATTPLTCSAGKAFNNYFSGSATAGMSAELRLDDILSRHSLGRNVFLSSSGKTQGWELYVEGGYLRFDEYYNSTLKTFAFPTLTLTPDRWHTVKLVSNASGVTLTLNGGVPVTKNGDRSNSCYSTTRAITFGDGAVSFRGTLSVWGTAYGAITTVNRADWSIASATVGAPLSLTDSSYTLTGGEVREGIG